MSEHFRIRRISEAIRRYVPVELDAGKHGVRDGDTGLLMPGMSYDGPPLARTQCRMLAAADIERLYMPDEPTALARVAIIVDGPGDAQAKARAIHEFYQGAKA